MKYNTVNVTEAVEAVRYLTNLIGKEAVVEVKKINPKRSYTAEQLPPPPAPSLWRTLWLHYRGGQADIRTLTKTSIATARSIEVRSSTLHAPAQTLTKRKWPRV